MSTDPEGQLDGQTFAMPKTGLLLLGNLQSRLYRQDLESFDRLNGGVGVHGTNSRVCYSFGVFVVRLHD